MLLRTLLVVVSLVPLLTSPLGSQAIRLDLTAANRHVWRGINRTTNWVAQFDLAAVAPLGRGAVAGGVFESRELRRSGAGSLTEVGLDRRGLGERDWWLEYRRSVGVLEIFAAATRYTFHGDQGLGGRSAADNTTEVSLGLKGKLAYASPALVAHWDVDRVRGLYLEGSTALPLLAWPFPPQVNVYFDAALGLSLGEGTNPDRRGELAYYADDGLTHMAIGLSIDLQGSEHFVAGLGARLQAGLDDRVRLGAQGRERNLFATYWLGTMLRMGRLPR